MRRFAESCKTLTCLGVGLAVLSGRPWLCAEPRRPTSDQKGVVHEVRWSGELKKVMMSGDLKGTIDLKALSKLPHVYAVGALEGLQGEVTILAGTPSIARVRDGKVVVSQVAQGKACVLVYAQVKHWKELPLPKAIRSLAQLEGFAVDAARKEGTNVNRPFPFLVKGKVTEAKYHVLRHPGAVKDPQDLHGKAQVLFTFKGGVVELVGFYSDQHLGIFTCGGNLHVHLRSADGKLSGHLDEVELGDEMRLYLSASQSLCEKVGQVCNLPGGSLAGWKPAPRFRTGTQAR
jgi:acetolactate decarboxylase